MANELFPEDLKAEDHEEAAAEDHEDHVEEEVAVVVVADTVVQPGAVVIHLEDATVADAAVMGSGRFWLDTFLAYSCHLKTIFFFKIREIWLGVLDK